MRCELTTDHTDTLKWFIKTVSVSWLLQANSRTQDRSQGTARRVWVPVPHHHDCLFPHSQRLLSYAGLSPP